MIWNIYYDNEKLLCDFKYIFQEISKTALIHDNLDFIKDFSFDNGNVIICSRNTEAITKKLSDVGLIRRRDYFFTEDIFYKLEKIYEIANEKKVYIWGCGKQGREYAHIVNCYGMPISGFIDNTFVDNFCGYKVYNPSEILIRKDACILISVKKTIYREEIKKQLAEYGYIQNEDYIIDDSFGIVTNMMKKTYFDYADKNNRWKCKHPFERINLNIKGDILPCCSSYVNGLSYGNILESNVDDIYDSHIAHIFKLSIINGTYSFCSYQNCPFLKEKKDDLSDSHYLYFAHKELYDVQIEIDYTCNLYCASCRNNIQSICGDDLLKANQIMNIVNKELINKAKKLIMSGSGEIFVSKINRKFLDDLEYIPKLVLLTNGQLIDENAIRRWSLKVDELDILVSIDAATKGVYEKLRRGAKWENLIENLKLLQQLKNEQIINKIGLEYLVQKDNWNDCDKFVDIGKDIKADEINFRRLHNWGMWTRDEFTKIDVLQNENNLKFFIDKYKENKIEGVYLYKIGCEDIYYSFQFDNVRLY